MKGSISTVFILLMLNIQSYTQYSDYEFSGYIKHPVQLAPDLTYENILQIKLAELYQIEGAFIYHKELRNNDFEIQEKNDEIQVKFGKNKRKLVKSSDGFAGTVTYRKKVVSENGMNFNVLEMVDEGRYINYDKAKTKFANEIGDAPDVFPLIGYIWSNSILIDKQICYFDQQHNYGDILNRTVTTQHLLDSNSQPCQLFADATDGVAILFPIENTWKAKLFTADAFWNRIIWYDQNLGSHPIARAYGNFGLGSGQFCSPTGITAGDLKVYYIYPNTYNEYPLFVADRNNYRIVKFIYRLTSWGYPYNYWTYEIVPGSYTVIGSYRSPYDIEHHTGYSTSDPNDDVLWFTSRSDQIKQLSAINAVNGNMLNSVNSFIYHGSTYPLNPSRISVYRSPDGQTNLLAVIDEALHAVLFFKLNPDGLLPSNPPVCTSGWRFYNWDNLTSVRLVSNNPVLGVNAFVSYNNPQNNGCVNVFKVNVLAGSPYAEYLASSFHIYNSSSGFKYLNNLASHNGYLDFCTLEKWDNSHGIRKYKPGLAILSESATEYYRAGNYMRITLKLTNPCRLDFSAKYNPGNGNWNDVNITNINGVIWQLGFAFLPSGSNIITVSLALPPPPNNPVPGEQVRVTVRLAAIDEAWMFTRVYDRDVIPGGSGGCPYVYVFDGDSLRQDNNILHRSEFSQYVGQDITDKYKLNSYVFIDPNDNTCALEIRELSQDFNYFDQFQLKAVDHPVGTELTVTENNDLVLYFPQLVISPDSALLNDSDVTCSMQYDSTCSPVQGDSSDGLITTMGGEASGAFGAKRNISQNVFTKIKNTFKSVIQIVAGNQRTKEQIFLDSDLEDSIAVIFDPQGDGITPVPAKWIAGVLQAFETESDYSSGLKEFARRENRSVVAVPVGRYENIDSVYTEWYRDFVVSFQCTTPIYYGGYIERDMELASAEHSVNGDIKQQLLVKDSYYAEMDNTGTITLRFSKPTDSIPEGWMRDYVFITDGRYINGDGDRLTSNNVVNNLPKRFALHQNYPNPFNPIAKIKYDLPKDVNVTIKVYDILGREVMTLVNDFKKAGYYETVFDGSNYASGVYFYRIEAGLFIIAKKMVLVK